MVETAFFNAPLLTTVALGHTMIASRLVDPAWLTRGWLAIASTCVPAFSQLQTTSIHCNFIYILLSVLDACYNTQTS